MNTGNLSTTSPSRFASDCAGRTDITSCGRSAEWRLTEFPCDVTHTVSTKDFMRWRPSAKIQNAVSVAKLSGPVAKPNGTCGETDVAQKQRDGIRSETVSGNFHDSRFHQRDTTSLPGDRAVIPSGTARLRS